MIQLYNCMINVKKQAVEEFSAEMVNITKWLKK